MATAVKFPFDFFIQSLLPGNPCRKESSSIFNLIEDKSMWDDDFEPLLQAESEDQFISSRDKKTKPKNECSRTDANKNLSPVFQLYENEDENPKVSEPCCDCRCNEACHENSINYESKWNQLTEINLDSIIVPGRHETGGGDDIDKDEKFVNYSPPPFPPIDTAEEASIEEPHNSDTEQLISF